jgi:hypothetical protein
VSARNHDSKARRVSRQRQRMNDSQGAAWSGLLKEMNLLSRVLGWLEDEVGTWRERRYGPLTTLVMFIGQVMSADQSCKNAVAQEAAPSQAAYSKRPGSNYPFNILKTKKNPPNPNPETRANRRPQARHA